MLQPEGFVWCLRKQDTRLTKKLVFNIFIHLFSLFLSVMKFILCVFWTFFNGFCRLTHLNKSPKMISCCTIHLADIPIGFTRVPFNNCDPTLWGSSLWPSVRLSLLNMLRAHLSTSHANSREKLHGCSQMLSRIELFHLKCTSVFLTLIVKHTRHYCQHHILTVTWVDMFTSQDFPLRQYCFCISQQSWPDTMKGDWVI